jgi:iduronate 2-sulfatase
MSRTPLTLVLISGLVLGLTAAEPQKNILLLCIDDLRPELACFGADYIESPNIDKLAENGRPFHRHYVNAPSCGPSRFTLLTGRYGAPGNDALFKRAAEFERDPDSVPPTMPEWFRTHGYTTVSVGKVSHHPGGRGGKNWDDDSKIEMPNAWDRHLMPCGEWETPIGAMHGLAHGEVRKKAGDMDLFQSLEGPDTIYPDGLIADEGIHQLEELAQSGTPFLLAIGLIKPHLPFGSPAEYMKPYAGVNLPPVPHPEKPKGQTTWHSSSEFMKYNRWGKDPRTDPVFSEEVRRHYAACVTYADKQVGDIMAALKKTGADKNTIVILWGDHGWHLGEHAIWGKHSLFEEALHSPLIISIPDLENPGVKADGVISTLDIFPTLCALTHTPVPEFTQGESLLPMLGNPAGTGHGAIAYRSNATTLRTDAYRITVHKNGDVELYDHTSPEKETLNIAAQNPELVAQLTEQLNEKMTIE